MALKALKKVAAPGPTVPTATVELPGTDPETGEDTCVALQFRAPRPFDLSDPNGDAARVRAQFPGLDAGSVKQATLLAACYLPDAEDEGLDAALHFAEMAVSDEWGFSDLGNRFYAAFPQFSGWCEKQAKQHAKNA